VKPVAIFAATRWECNAVRPLLTVERELRLGKTKCLIGRAGRWPCWLTTTGVGIENAAAAVALFEAYDFAVAVSTGFACALAPADIGDVLIATDVIDRTGANVQGVGMSRLACSSAHGEIALKAAAAAGLPAHRGSFVTASAVVWQAADKQALARRTSAIGLDMESAGLARAATEKGIPFVVIRTASDLVGESLPIDFSLFLTRGGWSRGVGACLKPSAWSGFLRLAQQSEKAMMRLTTFFGQFLNMDLELHGTGLPQ
jgi:adenosylhomocysteine nucleosidase